MLITLEQTKYFSEGDEFPFNYGYSEGYKIVKSYLDLHPDVNVEEWTGLSGKEIYEEGDYADY